MVDYNTFMEERGKHTAKGRLRIFLEELEPGVPASPNWEYSDWISARSSILRTANNLNIKVMTQIIDGKLWVCKPLNENSNKDE